MKLVSVGELRANLKEHLDAAKNGESVLIGRDNLVYVLRLLDTTTYPVGETKVPGGRVVVPEPFIPRPPDPETGYSCCLKRAPCKHWYFDGVSGAWTNELTGKTREVT